MKTKYWNLFELCIIIIYKLLLEYGYVHIQSVLFGYVGYDYVYSPEKLIIGWITYLLTYWIIRKDSDDIKTVFLYVIFLISITPFCVLVQFCPTVPIWMYYSQIICLWFLKFLLIDKCSIVRNIKNKYKFDASNKSFIFCVFTFLFLFLLFSFLRFGIPSLSSLLFENVYETRAENNLSVPEILVQNTVCKIICPLALLIAIDRKKILVILFLLIVQVYTYAVTGLKTYLFIPFMMIGIKFLPFILLKRSIVIGILLVVIIANCAYLFTDDVLVYALFENRLLFFPAYIKYSYFDYFSTHDFVYFSQNSISNLLGVKSNYSVNIPNMIGEKYFDKPGMWTNTGFMADAYSNMGFLGMAMMSCILAWAINKANRQITNIPGGIKTSIETVFLTFFITLNDGAVISVLFSGGMIIVILLMSFIDFRKL